MSACLIVVEYLPKADHVTTNKAKVAKLNTHEKLYLETR